MKVRYRMHGAPRCMLAVPTLPSRRLQEKAAGGKKEAVGAPSAATNFRTSMAAMQAQGCPHPHLEVADKWCFFLKTIEIFRLIFWLISFVEY